ncbi:cupin-like domain-containing protein [Paraglaciecola sp. L3A3]|uniref:cupin-like domain-containing protein n=1 Tax=Paraglaciecola sp. L3A3 TaxID=2686358 RepID=UPI00131DF49F|nr:cupin-like domain-containing protein [Paraglaciecola sp. L3A3]
MSNIKTKTKTIFNNTQGTLDKDVYSSGVPLVIKGLVKDWKLVELGMKSEDEAIHYLKSHYNGSPSNACIGEPEIKGRFFYSDDGTDLNFSQLKTTIDNVLDLIQQEINQKKPRSYYIASNLIDTHFPNFRQENDITIPRPESELPLEDQRTSIWIGNRTTACCHYDASDNLACCAVGKRKFTLFPPDQIANLYPGPLSPTPGGQALSMVDFDNPDYVKYPKFAQAEEQGQIAELEAGDALFLPSMWWHQVESQTPFNVLVNYWWSNSAKHMGPALNVLYHALLSLRDKPEHEKQAWKHIFDYYIFDDAKQASEHLPTEAQGYLGEIDGRKSRMLRALLLNKLNR